MKKTVLVFGILSGIVASVMMLLTMPFINNGTINLDNGLVVGYTSIFLSLVLVFFGIRSYRENHGGSISFGRGFAVGILITLISSLFYVATWQVMYYRFMPDFGDKYAAHMLAKEKAKGATPAQLAEKQKEMEQMKGLMANPVTNSMMTFIEPFPVGLVMTLVSAGILCRKQPALSS
ncbi:MAG: DUF4199 domain-containing protein [Acidobacteria bacterium]|nr:DUF4199 domain-containing protein [Acidobacteriota bacterium]